MKKGIVVLLVLLALVVIVSPGLVGHLAEKSMNEQVQWAARENSEIVVKSDSFERGWFSSEGTHRIEIGDTVSGNAMREALGVAAGDSPALLIETRLDHGLIPVASISREEGSLAPGLGRAVSTIKFQDVDGSVTNIPGVIYSDIGLTGGLNSHYFLEAGRDDFVSWGAADLRVEADASGGNVKVDGGFDALSIVSEGNNVYTFGKTDVTADVRMTDYGYTVGDMTFNLVSVELPGGMGNTMNIGPVRMVSNSSLDGDRVDNSVNMDFAMQGVPPVGDVSWTMDLDLDNVDAAALGRVIDSLEGIEDNADPAMMMAALQDDFADLVAAGFDLRINTFDITLPQGTLETAINVTVPGSDRQSFVWTGVLLAMEADASIRIPAGLYEFAAAMNPQVNAAVAMGILKRNGDNYELDAEFKNGNLTLNGAPMPLPFPGM